MFQRIYVKNFRCLENLELNLKDTPSALLIGKNGSGKSDIGYVLEIFQNIGSGKNNVVDLVKLSDFSYGRIDTPIRFEIEVLLNDNLYEYELVLKLNKNSRKILVSKENLYINSMILYTRNGSEVSLNDKSEKMVFDINEHILALSIIQTPFDDLSIFKNWLANIVILTPIPQLMSGESQKETTIPRSDVSNFGEWISGLLIRYPAAYNKIFNYIHGVIPDFEQFENEMIAKGARNTVVSFKSGTAKLSLDFNQLSDGQKCYFICGMVLATNYHQPSFFFWDEPDNHISLSEVRQLIIALRSSFKDNGQLLITSHNDQVISSFSSENTFLLDRKSHFEPTLIKRLDEIQELPKNLIDALICGDIRL